MLVGDPGGGKSTFAKHLCVCLAAHALNLEGDWAERLKPLAGAGTDLVPLFVELRRFADTLPTPLPTEALPRRLWEFIQETLKDFTLDLTTVLPQLQHALEDGKALIVLDGLDEVATREKKLAVRDAIQQFARGNFKRSRMMVTCRTRSYRDRPWQLTGFGESFELADFDELKIENFVRRWYEERREIDDNLTESEAAGCARSLWDAIRDPHFPELLEVARSPLRLTVMALVHNHESDRRLPRESAKLYSRMVDILLFRWEDVKLRGELQAMSLSRLLAESNLKENDLVHELGQMAYLVHERADKKKTGKAVPVAADPPAARRRAKSTADATEDQSLDVLQSDLVDALKRLHPEGDEVWRARVIRLIKERAGLLMEVDDEVFAFPHGSFREYLAGLYLADAENFLESGDLIDPSRHWWEVVKWAAGWLMHVNPSKRLHSSVKDLVQVLSGGQRPGEAAGWRKVILAGEIVVIMKPDALGRLPEGPKCLSLVQDRLCELIETEALPAFEREQAGIVLGKLGDRRSGVIELPKSESDKGFWIEIPKGPFVMGSTKKESHWGDEKPRFTCDLIQKPYRISRYPITVAQYQVFLDDKGYEQGRFWTGEGWKWRTREDRWAEELRTGL